MTHNSKNTMVYCSPRNHSCVHSAALSLRDSGPQESVKRCLRELHREYQMVSATRYATIATVMPNSAQAPPTALSLWS